MHYAFRHHDHGSRTINRAPSNMDEHEATRLLHLLEEAKSQLSQEQRRREEADRRFREEQQRREEERQRREEADRQREEADRQREEAVAVAAAARPQTIPDYLEACHQLSLAIDIVTDKTLTTQGEPTKPAGRKFPQQIIPWDNFAASQEETWSRLAADNAFFTNTIYPSANQVDYIASLNRPISSELDLRNFERDTVENAVQILLDQICGNQRLRNNLDIQGTVMFKNHTNLGDCDK
ncbi:serine threonine protein kinase [Purpureocillium lilacinum]|uniref:Serine threonine protein kinase n=1 Tax=Purpureocillium lilacinum TaxID=33203 RepID=A0A179F4R4_PURLI|nr:serine threonine protein kinase [Purpureocillium lilacinum]OAQ60414.1 serine threonine protein kinase [Purpureocillium lilacinum]